MKVLYFHQHFSTPQGSSGIRSYEMAKHLLACGHSVTIVCGSYTGGQTGLTSVFKNGMRRGNVEGIEVIELELAYANTDGFVKRALTFSKFALRSVVLALHLKYDLVFATTTPLTAGIPGIMARWFRCKPFVFEVRDLWPELPKAMGVIRNPLVLGTMSALEWMSYRSAHGLIALSPGIAEGIAKRGVSPQLITMIPNGCDLGIFTKPAEPWRPPEIAVGDLLAVYAGTHGTANGLGSLLSAAAVLKQRKRADIKILLLGQGREKPQLMARAKAESLDNVIFQTPIQKSKLAGLLASTDIGIQCLANVPAFYYGTSPNKFFDYIAAGLPVLNNYPGWIADLISKHNCGFAVPPDNATAMADALELAASDRKGLKEKGQQARILAKTQFNRADLAEKWVNILEIVCK